MEVAQMQRSLVDYMKSLFFEGFLDSQFLQLQQLQDESSPDFVVEIVSVFFEDSEKLLRELTSILVGAQRVKSACMSFRGSCEEQNFDGCVRCLQQVKHEYFLLKNKLETMFRLEQQIVAAGALVPVLEMSF